MIVIIKTTLTLVRKRSQKVIFEICTFYDLVILGEGYIIIKKGINKMNLVWLATALIPKKDRNEFDRDENGVIKSKNAWKKDIYTNLVIFIVSVFFVVTMEIIPIPYLGFFTFIAGIGGLLKSVYCIFRALVILKEYDNIFSEDLIKKIIE